jgi:ABC-type nitrate/sulfonate/bicarbonate transport system ATPase subunit
MSIDYINESYFAVLGLTGAGKSSFLNAINDTESCEVGKKDKSCTQKNQLVTFLFNNQRFNALDT